MVTQEEIKDWYNRKHTAKGEKAWRPSHAYPIFLNYLQVEPENKFLDIGCGTGYLLREAERRGLETYGVDISAASVKIVQRISPESKVSLGSGEDLKFPDHFFDYVTCLGALEHFLDIRKGLREMKRVAKKDARFCVVVPNINCFLWKNADSRGTDQQDINETLLSLKEWKNIFRGEGFGILKIEQDRWFVRDIRVFSSANPLGIAKRALYKLFLPLNYAYQFIFILEKNEAIIDFGTGLGGE